MSRSPFDFDISVTADKKRRARGRGFSGAVETSSRQCEKPGCARPGKYRAPKSPDNLDDFHWFCLDHVREYNLQWNFFESALRRGARAAVRCRPRLGAADPADARPERPAPCRGPGVAAIRLRRPDGAARRQGDAEPGQRPRHAGRSASCRRRSGARSRSSRRRTPRPRARSAASTRPWSRISTPT